jgi:hypothetical protein
MALIDLAHQLGGAARHHAPKVPGMVGGGRDVR